MTTKRRRTRSSGGAGERRAGVLQQGLEGRELERLRQKAIEARRRRGLVGVAQIGGERDDPQAPGDPERLLEDRALADRAVDGDLALHPLDDAAGDGEAEAGAAVTPAELCVALLELLEQARHAVFGDAWTGVVNRKREHAVAALLDDHPDAAGLGELHRVAGEVDEDLAQPILVADDARRHLRRDEGRDLDALALGFGRKQLDHALDHGTEVERLGEEFDPAGLDLREVEDLVDEREERLPRGLHGADIGRLLGAGRGVEEEPGHADDAVQRRAELVADGREEARFRLARRLGLGAGLLKGALGSDPFGDVAAGALELRRAVAAGDRRLDPGQPADAVRGPDRLVDDAGAVGADARGAALDHRRTLARTDQRLAGRSHELGEALVGEGDAPLRLRWTMTSSWASIELR